MNRSDLIDDLAARFVNLTKNDTEFAVNTLLDAMQDALVAGHHIELRGFGSFSMKQREARIRRNPRNGDSVGGGSWGTCGVLWASGLLVDH